MNIVDKIIQNFCGDSGADSGAERGKSGLQPIIPQDNGGRIWKDRTVTLKSKARANAAYEKLYSKRYNIHNLFDDFNSDGCFTDALMGLDCLTAEQRGEFTDICRQLAHTCGRREEKEFYRVVRRGYSDDYSAANCGRPDLSVMRDISPKDYPYFLAVCAASKNGYMREEAQRLGAEYPILLSIIVSGFNDNIKEVRAAAENAFDIALDRLSGAFEESSDTLIKEITAPLFWYPHNKSGDELRHIAMAVLFRARRRLEEISCGGRYDPRRLRHAENRLEETIVKNLNEENIVYLSERRQSIPLAVSSLHRGDVLCVYNALTRKNLISCDTAAVIMAQPDWKWVKDRRIYMNGLFRDISYERLVSFAFYPEPLTRQCAAVRLFEEYGLWEGAEKLLTDPAAIVRERAVHYFEKLSDIDLHGFYMDRLPEIPAVKGLALCSRTAEQKAAAAAALRLLINSGNDRTAAAAVAAVCSLAAVCTSEGISDEFYELIKDPRPKTSKAALRAFLKAGKPLDCKRIYGDILKEVEMRKKQMTRWERERLQQWGEMPQMLSMTARRLAKALCIQQCPPEEKLPLALRLCVSENDGVSRAASVYVSNAIRYDPYVLSGFKDSDKEEIRQALEEIKPKGLGYWEKKIIGQGLEEAKKKGLRPQSTDFSDFYESWELMI